MLMLKSTHDRIVSDDAKKLGEQAQFIRKLTDERDQLADELYEAKTDPFPEWLNDMKAQIRAVSGYDGYDDAIDGIDLPEELRDLIDVMTQEADKVLAAARADREVADAKDAAEHYRKLADHYRVRLSVFTAPRKRNSLGHFLPTKGAEA